MTNTLYYLFFVLGVLQRESGDGSDWQQDCLASLLKILTQLGLEPVMKENRPTRNDKIIIPNFNGSLLSLLDVKSTMDKLTGILEQASMPKDPNHYKTGFWGRAQVVHYAMALLVSWLYCCEEARIELFRSHNFSDWLKRLVCVFAKCSFVSRLPIFNLFMFNSKIRFWRIQNLQWDERYVLLFIVFVLGFQPKEKQWRAVLLLLCYPSYFHI